MNKQKVLVLTTLSLILVVFLAFYFYKPNISGKVTGTSTSINDQDINKELSIEEARMSVDDVFSILITLHYVSLIDINSTEPELVISDTIEESLNDIKKLEKLLPQTAILLKSKDELVSTTGLVLDLTVKNLIDANSKWVNHLRGINQENVNLSEFQYQMANFKSSTHDAYLTLVEGASLFPMITVKFGTASEKNSFNEELKSYIVSKMDDMFASILNDSVVFYSQTGERYAVAVLIEQYKKFFNQANLNK